MAFADHAGLDHVGFGDHVSFHTGAGSDGLLAAASARAVSDHLSANTAVSLLPVRHPVPVARQLADIAALAPGRFVFGVGIGGEDPARGRDLRRGDFVSSPRGGGSRLAGNLIRATVALTPRTRHGAAEAPRTAHLAPRSARCAVNRRG